MADKTIISQVLVDEEASLVLPFWKELILEKTPKEANLISVKSVTFLSTVNLSSVECKKYENFYDAGSSRLSYPIINIEDETIKHILEIFVFFVQDCVFFNWNQHIAEQCKEKISIGLDAMIANGSSRLEKYCIGKLEREPGTKNTWGSIYILYSNSYYLLNISLEDDFFDKSNCDCYNLMVISKDTY